MYGGEARMQRMSDLGHLIRKAQPANLAMKDFMNLAVGSSIFSN